MSTITFFPVDCGDMTLIRLPDQAASSILIDVNIRASADDPDDSSVRDVASDLRTRLQRDALGRPYVDVFMLSHPDEDHCLGLSRHFYLGPIADYPDDKKPDKDKRIVIREIWSSPLVFRRRSKNHVLCDDAVAFNREAKRRVKQYRQGLGNKDGERVLLMGEDVDGKTDDLTSIVIKPGTTFGHLNGAYNSCFEATLLAPILCDEPDIVEELKKNNSSIVINFALDSVEPGRPRCKFLSGGDAEVYVWELLWAEYEHDDEALRYDLLQAPHHCSWHSLSWDSWSDKGQKALVSEGARAALAQAKSGAVIVASSKRILDDKNDPPCIRAKREYESILAGVGGKFMCTGEYPQHWEQSPLDLQVSYGSVRVKKAGGGSSAVAAIAAAPRAGSPQ
ncbi:metallohydrolase [Stenotrophomonas maltophilia]|uniref:metallohydrolase n=1 Tax=Stenotrophomonas maltophilia TaxID=40324 RepID=UPI000DB4B986|nr:metallohydrolase [Stenotrophomonas maltophilia]PZS55048.1 metallohydrolase [Stenotrophomonas maltophilia]